MIIHVRDITISVVNRHNTPGGDYVGRPSPLGNPFKIGRHGTRLDIIEVYTAWLREKIAKHDPAVCNELEQLRKKALQTKNLVLTCWCVPLQCHATVIASFLAKVLADQTGFVADAKPSGGPKMPPKTWASGPAG